jgi:hypothetical protein
MKIAVGDDLTPTLKPTAGGLRTAADQGQGISANAAGAPLKQSKAANLSAAISNKSQQPPPTSCKQKIWFSFFFDGTGNNLKADLGTLKHSNVARLYRAHYGLDPRIEPGKKSPDGIYRLYLPGVGTYFPEIGDVGAATFMGGAMGRKGDDRLNYAKNQFYLALDPHFKDAHSPQHEILEINISAYGFSRGAALARAFIQRFVKKECYKTGSQLFLNKGDYKINIKFMGIFDTVASVGPPASANNTDTAGGLFSNLTLMLNARTQDELTNPAALAFAENAAAGADPDPGWHDGHDTWGGELEIPLEVEEVRHFVAAHEIRNSFPLDSVSVLRGGKIVKHPQFYEVVYPGVHSDVGGSYRPGEGGKSDRSEKKIGLIAGNDMYELALAKGIPFKPRSAWGNDNVVDFKYSDETLEIYRYYLSKTASAGSLGDLFNSHMGLYYAWRFRSIRLKRNGDTTEAKRIRDNDKVFQADSDKLDKEIADLDKQNSIAHQQVVQSGQQMAYASAGGGLSQSEFAQLSQNMQNAKNNYARTNDALLSAQAEKDALPTPAKQQLPALGLYDSQLYDDAYAIYRAYHVYTPNGYRLDQKKRDTLRPHYKLMMDAFEAEFVAKKGLTDQKIIDFFELYVHDSLSGFAKDGTLPSDPRVIYLGGNEKFRYAMIENQDSEKSVAYA